VSADAGRHATPKVFFTTFAPTRYRDGADNTVEAGELQRFLPNPNALVAVSKGMRAVKLCTNKLLQFLTGGAANAD